MRFTPHAEYAFRHPLIRAVAYESQLKSDRAEWHRRLAAAIQEREPGVGRRERGADRRTSRGRRRAARRLRLAHARRRVVDQPRHRRRAAQLGAGPPASPTQLPDDDPDQTVDAHRAPHHAVRHRLASRSADSAGAASRNCGSCAPRPATRRSLAIGMTGLVIELLYAGRAREASRLASEQMALLESIGDPTLTIGLAFAAFCQGTKPAKSADDLAVVADRHRPGRRRPRQGRRLRYGIAAGGGVGMARRRSVVAGPSRMAAGPRRRRRDGPKQRPGDPRRWSSPGPTVSRSSYGVLRADDSAVREIEEAVQIAERIQRR